MVPLSQDSRLHSPTPPCTLATGRSGSAPTSRDAAGPAGPADMGGGCKTVVCDCSILSALGEWFSVFTTAAPPWGADQADTWRSPGEQPRPPPTAHSGVQLGPGPVGLALTLEVQPQSCLRAWWARPVLQSGAHPPAQGFWSPSVLSLSLFSKIDLCIFDARDWSRHLTTGPHPPGLSILRHCLEKLLSAWLSC